ncbi:MAG: 16S rRNA (adenine(1518)-N(6)/adenine(1519)-N(6))-dimethyltransferase, partial [Colwellia sp.]|nr:16S rRNA (adenine(1518)-N(6)/adenine(1519)-N(6))-dimethyltransferase [Colwellia sp.]
KVDSAIVRLVPHKTISNPVKDLNALNTVCLAAFNQRRKTIRNSFKKLITIEQLESLDIDASLRPENLSLDDYIKLANFIADNPPQMIEVNESKSSRRATKAEQRKTKAKE